MIYKRNYYMQSIATDTVKMTGFPDNLDKYPTSLAILYLHKSDSYENEALLPHIGNS